MTSYVREGLDRYNGIVAPQYNVLSYTWGYFQDKSVPPLVIHGVDWPIPGIDRNHFSTETFHNAILAAAKGIRHSCEWLWVDIACIPQEHKGETEEAKAIRNQEIGRQVEIFQRAEDAFAWFSSLRTTELLQGKDAMVRVEDILGHLNAAIRGLNNVQDATNFLTGLESMVQVMENWTRRLLNHPWFRSLWTLQEMVLRSDAFLLFDDGFLNFDKNREEKPTNTDTTVSFYPWSFIRMKNDIWMLRIVVTDDKRIKIMKDAEMMASQLCYGIEPVSFEGLGTSLFQRLQDLLDSQATKGLNSLNIAMPNSAYSMAQYRRVTKPMDRIYGIMQTYGISCKSDPPGDDDLSKLHALEDELGVALVSKRPMISQLFIHAPQSGRPRRTWLITQDIKADDEFWQHFSAERSPRTFFTRLDISASSDSSINSLEMNFKGKAWHLTEFVERSSPRSEWNTPVDQKLLYRQAEHGLPDKYRGLMLDHHVSRGVLGHVVDYFDNYEAMSEAVHTLQKIYCGFEQSGDTLPSIRVALLGSGATVPFLPIVNYVGIVLAPCISKDSQLPNSASMRRKRSDECRIAECMKWERIGIMRWTEIYHDSNDESLHYLLPPYHDFECQIV